MALSYCITLFALYLTHTTEGVMSSKKLEDISYYGHKWKQVREGSTFFIICFSPLSTNISWTKNGWPVEFVFVEGYAISQHLDEGNGKLSRLLVHNARAQHAGKYRCSNASTSFHKVSIRPIQESPRLSTAVVDCVNVVPNEPLKLPCSVPLANHTPSSIIWYKDAKLYIPDARSSLLPTTLEIRETHEGDVGTYSCCLISAASSAKTYSTEFFRVVTPIRIVPFPSVLEAHWGDSFHMPCRARSLPQPHVAWYKGKNVVPKDVASKDLPVADPDPHIDQAVLSLRKIERLSAGVYTCVAYHKLCGEMVARRSMRLQVRENRLRTNEEYPGLGITLDPASETLRLSCVDSQDPATPIKWKKGEKDLDDYPVKHKFSRDPVDQSLIIHNPSSDDIDNYTCVAPKTGEEAVILVGLKAQIHQQATPASGRVEGKRLYMHCKVTGFPLPSVRWFRNNKLVQISKMTRFNYRAAFGVYPDTLEIATLSKEDNGVYACSADNGHSYDIKMFKIDVISKADAFIPFFLICGEVLLVCAFVYKYFYDYQRGSDVRAYSMVQIQPQLTAPSEPDFPCQKEGTGQQSSGQPEAHVEPSGLGQAPDQLPQGQPDAKLTSETIVVQSPEQFRSSKVPVGLTMRRKKRHSVEYIGTSQERLIRPDIPLKKEPVLKRPPGEDKTDFKFQRTITEKEVEQRSRLLRTGMTMKPLVRTSFSKRLGYIDFSLGMAQMVRPEATASDISVEPQASPTPGHFTFASTKARSTSLSPKSSTAELLPSTASTATGYTTLSSTTRKASALSSTVHSRTSKTTTAMSDVSDRCSTSGISTAQVTETSLLSTTYVQEAPSFITITPSFVPASLTATERKHSARAPPVQDRIPKSAEDTTGVSKRPASPRTIEGKSPTLGGQKPETQRPLKTAKPEAAGTVTTDVASQRHGQRTTNQQSAIPTTAAEPTASPVVRPHVTLTKSSLTNETDEKVKKERDPGRKHVPSSPHPTNTCCTSTQTSPLHQEMMAPMLSPPVQVSKATSLTSELLDSKLPIHIKGESTRADSSVQLPHGKKITVSAKPPPRKRHHGSVSTQTSVPWTLILRGAQKGTRATKSTAAQTTPASVLVKHPLEVHFGKTDTRTHVDNEAARKRTSSVQKDDQKHVDTQLKAAKDRSKTASRHHHPTRHHQEHQKKVQGSVYTEKSAESSSADKVRGSTLPKKVPRKTVNCLYGKKLSSQKIPQTTSRGRLPDYLFREKPSKRKSKKKASKKLSTGKGPRGTTTKPVEKAKWSFLHGITSLLKPKHGPRPEPKHDESPEENLPPLVLPVELSSSSEDSDEWVAKSESEGRPFEGEAMDSSGFETHIGRSAVKATARHATPGADETISLSAKGKAAKDGTSKLAKENVAPVKGPSKTVTTAREQPDNKDETKAKSTAQKAPEIPHVEVTIETTEGFGVKDAFETAAASVTKPRDILKGPTCTTDTTDSVKAVNAGSRVAGPEERTQEKLHIKAAIDDLDHRRNGKTDIKDENRREEIEQSKPQEKTGKESESEKVTALTVSEKSEVSERSASGPPKIPEGDSTTSSDLKSPEREKSVNSEMLKSPTDLNDTSPETSVVPYATTSVTERCSSPIEASSTSLQERDTSSVPSEISTSTSIVENIRSVVEDITALVEETKAVVKDTKPVVEDTGRNRGAESVNERKLPNVPDAVTVQQVMYVCGDSRARTTLPKLLRTQAFLQHSSVLAQELIFLPESVPVSPSLQRAVMNKACRRGLLQSVQPTYLVHKDEKIIEETDRFNPYEI
ncbi:uncharacterized protein LOC135395936 [Ornithodoros turicata]|uniref:uncharacterized protein LOC135395936 n=1 Tax=Ornithodoros turicata TaxID=34597 RepID=UPI003139309E